MVEDNNIVTVTELYVLVVMHVSVYVLVDVFCVYAENYVLCFIHD